jgi:L-aminopeptidase/D-esterase-like protein
VTAIVPDVVDRAGGELAAGFFVGNGFGKLIGVTQLVELAVIETPILLTGTLSAFRAADALVTYLHGLQGNEGLQSVNPVVGETNDGYLSDVAARPITEQHVLDVLDKNRRCATRRCGRSSVPRCRRCRRRCLTRCSWRSLLPAIRVTSGMPYRLTSF